AWGDNSFGQLGDGTHSQRSTPTQVLGPNGSGNLLKVVGVAAGQYHSLAVKRDGTVWAWGGDVSGQLGNNSTASHTSPVQVALLTGVAAVAAGQYHSLALKSDGTVWAWGKNDSGQLGASSSSTCGSGYPCSAIPLRVTALPAATAIAAGGAHSI